MANKQQIKLVHVAVRAAGITDGRYRLLLGQYRRSNGQAVTSSTQLTNAQVDDLLAICEGMGWRHPEHPADYFRTRVRRMDDGGLSGAQIGAILHLADDLGWNRPNLKGMLRRMTQRTEMLDRLTRDEAWTIIEAMKNMVMRQTGMKKAPLAAVAAAVNGTTD